LAEELNGRCGLWYNSRIKERMMKFPYGLSDFYKVITQGYFYVDRTSYIRLIEETGDQLLLLRPRRFGKSMLLSMVENY
jgi:hypothetical protein